jgi:hypothetical protein
MRHWYVVNVRAIIIHHFVWMDLIGKHLEIASKEMTPVNVKK